MSLLRSEGDSPRFEDQPRGPLCCLSFLSSCIQVAASTPGKLWSLLGVTFNDYRSFSRRPEGRGETGVSHRGGRFSAGSVPVYNHCSGLIASVPFHSQKCPSSVDKFYGHPPSRVSGAMCSTNV